MNPTTLDPAAVRRYRPPQHRVTSTGLLRSEWIKFWSVRSVVWTMVAAFVCTVGLGALFSWGISQGLQDPEARAAMSAGGALDPTALSLSGAQLASLVVGAVGVVVIAGEFSTGMIRTTFTAAPRRFPAFLAKALVLAVSVAAVMAVAVFAAFSIGQAIFATQDAGVSIGDDGVLRAVVGTVALQVGVALAGLGLGALMRNSAAAICTVAALLLVVPNLLLLLPESWYGPTITRYFFANTATPFVTVEQAPDGLSLAAGIACFTAWVLAFLLAGAVRLQRRDV